MTASHPAGGDESGNPNKNLWAPPEGTCPAPPAEKNPLVKLLYQIPFYIALKKMRGYF
jgi:hypothetical protein